MAMGIGNDMYHREYLIWAVLNKDSLSPQEKTAIAELLKVPIPSIG
jgi:hypothetical protein